MSIPILIAISFSIGFFIESIVGFGGGLIAYSILVFFIDVKEMVIGGLYIGTLASSYIIITDHKSFDSKTFKSIFPICLIATICGVFIFSEFSSKNLSFGLGLILIIISIKTFFFDRVTLPKIFKNKLLFLGGISQGAFGIGGPFVVNAVRKEFKNKSALRTTMAVFFASFNLIRFPQLVLQNQIKAETILNIWWTIIPVFIAIKLGHLIHLKISEELVKKSIALITVLSGIKFISEYFR